MMTASVLSLLFGGAGAWGYERFLARPAADRQTPAPAPQGPGQEVRKDIASMEDRNDCTLPGQIEQSEPSRALGGLFRQPPFHAGPPRGFHHRHLDLVE